MSIAPHFRLTEGGLNDKALGEVNPETARRAVLEYLKPNGNISLTARLFAIQRAIVYDIIGKDKEGNWKDRSKVPKQQPKKTSPAVESKVNKVKSKRRINYHLSANRLRKGKREFVDCYSAKPFEIVPMDSKPIRGQIALTKEPIIHLDRYDIPNSQTPFAYLKSQLPEIDDRIRFVIPIMLDKVSGKLGP